jgi:hypothetical protein
MLSRITGADPDSWFGGEFMASAVRERNGVWGLCGVQCDQPHWVHGKVPGQGIWERSPSEADEFSANETPIFTQNLY